MKPKAETEAETEAEVELLQVEIEDILDADMKDILALYSLCSLTH